MSVSLVYAILEALQTGLNTLTTELPGGAHIGAQSAPHTQRPYAVLIPQAILGTRSDAISNIDYDTLVTIRVFGDSMDTTMYAMQKVMTFFEDPSNYASLPSSVQEMQPMDGVWPLANAPGSFGDVNFIFIVRGDY